MTGALHNFQCNELFVLQVPAEPDCAEVSPAELPDDVVSVVEEVADLDRVVAALLVIPGSFLLVIVRSKDLLLLLVLLRK